MKSKCIATILAIVVFLICRILASNQKNDDPIPADHSAEEKGEVEHINEEDRKEAEEFLNQFSDSEEAIMDDISAAEAVDEALVKNPENYAAIYSNKKNRFGMWLCRKVCNGMRWFLKEGDIERLDLYTVVGICTLGNKTLAFEEKMDALAETIPRMLGEVDLTKVTKKTIKNGIENSMKKYEHQQSHSRISKIKESVKKGWKNFKDWSKVVAFRKVINVMFRVVVWLMGQKKELLAGLKKWKEYRKNKATG